MNLLPTTVVLIAKDNVVYCNLSVLPLIKWDLLSSYAKEFTMTEEALILPESSQSESYLVIPIENPDMLQSKGWDLFFSEEKRPLAHIFSDHFLKSVMYILEQDTSFLASVKLFFYKTFKDF